MPLYEYECLDCGKTTEILTGVSNREKPSCGSCGSGNVRKLLSAPSSMSGVTKNRMPGLGDTACCGKTPSEAGCAGPGSCCGRR